MGREGKGGRGRREGGGGKEERERGEGTRVNSSLNEATTAYQLGPQSTCISL